MQKQRKQDSVYTFDQFFTKFVVVDQCIDFFLSKYSWDDFNIVVEPSAGTGSFFYKIPATKRIGIELDPRLCADHPSFIRDSFYNWSTKNKKVAVIGNPPFGTQNSESVKFFNHAAKFADVIAFIIPRTWENTSIQNRLDLNFSLLDSLILDNKCFEGEKSTSVRCCFQIWKRMEKPRKKVKEAITHNDWQFLKYTGSGNDLHPPADADFVVLAYGSNPGQMSDDLYRWRPKSVHFIKSNIDVEELKFRFASLDFTSSDNSARQSTLGKAKLVKLYGEHYV